MTEAKEHCWKLCISGADRRELADAFRESQWKDSWFDRASLMDDEDPDAGMNISLPIPDMDTLITALKCIGHLRPTYGINLWCDADYGPFKASASLCSTFGGFAVSSAMIHRSHESLKLEAVKLLGEAEAALGELRNILAVKGGE